MTGALRRAAATTVRFLWSFLFDDTPEVLLVAAAVVGAAYGLRHERAAAVVVLPLLAVLGLGLTVWRAHGSEVGTRSGPRT